MTEINVIICSHNRPQFLRETLYNLSRQTLPCKVIVVDDSDELFVIPHHEFPALKIFSHVGFDGLYHRVAKFNEGVRLSTSPYVVLLDDDAIPVHETFCETYLKCFSNAPVVRGVFLQEDGSYKLPPWFSTANIGFERKTWDDIGGFDMLYDGRYGYEDTDMAYEIGKRGLLITNGVEGTAVRHVGEPFSGDRVAQQENERRYRSKWSL